ncbi:MAG: hypothetical protein AAB512_01695 [Patescibacteria group bacterium]
MRYILNFFLPVSLLLFSIFAGFVIHNATGFASDNHFTKLAVSFSKNDLFLSPYNLPGGDYADYYGRQYLFFGPLPSIVLVPFIVFFGENFPQIFLSFISIAVTYIIVFRLTQKLKFSYADSMWLANFFVFGTVLYFVSLLNISAYVVQAFAMSFAVLCIYEYFASRRWFLTGVYLSLAFITRATYLGLTLFFLLEIIRTRKQEGLAKPLIYFLIPLFVSVLSLSYYNNLRFHSFFDTGYTRNVTVVNSPTSNFVKGAFGIWHVPGNLYALLVASPEAIKNTTVDFVLKFPYLKVNGIGLAIWFTSPLFVYLIKAKRRPYTSSAILGTIALLVPSLLYFGIGTTQYGYRYSLDFIPLLFIILLSAFRERLPLFGKVLIFGGILFNCFYMLSIWNSYPLFFWLK